MLYGRLPQLDGTAAPPAKPARPSRRRFVALGLWFTAGSAAGMTIHGSLRGGASAAEASSNRGAVPAHGSLDWAWTILDAPDEELLQAAGDLERVSARHRDEDGLIPIFERLLDVALRTPGAASEIARSASSVVSSPPAASRVSRFVMLRRGMRRAGRPRAASWRSSWGRFP